MQPIARLCNFEQGQQSALAGSGRARLNAFDHRLLRFVAG